MRAQLALEYPREATSVWRDTWDASVGHSSWISGDICYHEVCAILDGTGLQLWDPTEGNWMEQKSGGSQVYGRLLALRLFSDDAIPGATFMGRRIGLGEWVFFDR